eukprot:g527.t1
MSSKTRDWVKLLRDGKPRFVNVSKKKERDNLKSEEEYADLVEKNSLCNWIHATKQTGSTNKDDKNDESETVLVAHNIVTGEERPLLPNYFKNGKALAYGSRSCFLWDTSSTFREMFVSIVSNDYFDNFILFVIILNSISLAIPVLSVAFGVDLEYDLAFSSEQTRASWWSSAYSIFVSGDRKYEGNPGESNWSMIADSTDIVFTLVFTVEAILKIIAMGFAFDKGSYLRDGWNVIDFTVVVAGLLAFIPGFPRISALRTIRVMRPLRSLSVMPSMKSLINTLIDSIPALLNVVMLLVFVFLIFGILSIQLWAGIQTNRCRISAKPLAIPNDTLVYECSASAAVTDSFLCEGPNGELPKFECSSTNECVVKEHLALLGEVFGSGTDAPELAKKYGAAMVTRVFIQSDGSVVPLHFCGYDEANSDNANVFPSYYEGLFPGRERLRDNSLESTRKLVDLTAKDGPWAEKEWDCFWPIYEDGRVCSAEDVGLGDGLNTCGRRSLPFPSDRSEWLLSTSEVVRAAHPQNCSVAHPYWNAVHPDSNGNVSSPQCFDIESYFDERRAESLMFVHTTCGSDLDIYGNRRFLSEAVHESGIFVEDLAFGYVQFNDIFHAFQTIFQSITEEGWTDIMYQIMDADNPFFAAVYFCTLIIFGSFVCLNLTLAVMWDEFSKAQEALEVRAKQEKKVRMKHGALLSLFSDNDADREKEASKTNNDGDDTKGTATKEREDDDGVAATTPSLSFYYFGLPGSHAASSSSLVRQLHHVVKTTWFDMFIVACILLNTVTLSMDRYDQPRAESDALEVVNFILAIIFAVEMILKIIGLGLREYVADRFNQFDAVIVVASLIEMSILPPTFLDSSVDPASAGGALSVMRAFRLFRLFKLARSWTSLQKLLKTMAKTLNDISSFALLLLLFIYIFALCGMQFFANRFRFGDDGRALDLTVNVVASAADDIRDRWNQSIALYDMPTTLWEDPESGDFINPEFVAAESQRAHFDDFPWACATVFQVLSGENWNTVMYDGWRSTSWAATLFFGVLIVLGIMIVLELFVAVLLSNFEGGDDDDNDEDKKEKVKKTAHDDEDKGNEQCEETKKSDDVAPVSLFDRAFNALEFGSAGSNAGARVAPVNTKEIDDDSSSGMKKKKKKASASGDEKILRGTSLWLMCPTNPIRVAVSKIVFNPWFDRIILVLIVISSLLLAIETPLDDPDSSKSEVIKALDWVFTIAFIVEMFLKHVTLGVMYYWKDGWNVLDGIIVIVSIVVKASEGNSSLSALRALRTLRVLRPLRMINRAPGLKRVVKALLYSVPKILDVFIVCTLFFLIFAIVGINFLKGKLNMCDGDFTSAEGHFLLEAKWSELDVGTSDVTWTWRGRLIEDSSPFASCAIGDPQGADVSYFDANGNFQYNFDASNDFFLQWDSVDGAYVHYDSLEDWADENIPYNFNTDERDISCRCENGRYECLTSKDACLALRATGRDVDWVGVTYQNFDDIFSAMSALFELSTTEGWVDVMYAAVDARGLDMQPSRDTNAFEWVIFFVAFIIWGSFFVMNLFVGVVCDTFNEMQEKFGTNFLLTDHQKKWVEMQKRITKLGPFLRARVLEKAPKSKLQQSLYDIVSKPSFDNFIMSCIVVNSFLLMLRWHGQSHELSTTLVLINFVFALIFTVEAVMKLVALRLRYFDDGWNVFDFVIVVATDIFIVLRYTTSLNLVSLATVMRTFRVLRIFRLVRSAKELRKLINTLIISLPQLSNVAMLLALFLFIFAVMGVQMFAKIAFEEAYNEHANFQTFPTAVLTLLRATTGENWNGMMYDMGAQTDQCIDDPSYTPIRCGFQDANDECLDLNGCGKPTFAQFFWIMFSLLVSFMVLNMFVALILDSFENVGDDEDNLLKDDQWGIFCSGWIDFIEYDPKVPESAFRIRHEKLVPFLKKLQYPMGFLREKTGTVLESKKQVEREVENMDVPLMELSGSSKSSTLYVDFMDVASAVAKRAIVLDSEMGGDDAYEELHKAQSHLLKTGKIKRKAAKNSKLKLNAKQYYAAARIATAYRAIKFREQLSTAIEKAMKKKGEYVGKMKPRSGVDAALNNAASKLKKGL